MQKINHAGYDRSIIYRKPQRYDEDGDLIFEDDLDDEDAELSPAEDDIYAEIKLEGLHFGLLRREILLTCMSQKS